LIALGGHAEQFRAAGKYLPTAKERGFPFSVEMAIPVCSAFALELYFKCLIAIAGKAIPQDHDLKKLFNKMSPEHKTKVRDNSEVYLDDLKVYLAEGHQKAGKPVPVVDFNFVLRASRGAFELARYFYETGLPAGKGWIADPIMEGARNTILELHPDWERARAQPLLTTRTQPIKPHR